MYNSSWHDVSNELKHMSKSERMLFVKMFFLPWSSTKQNVFMWIKIISILLIGGFSTYSIHTQLPYTTGNGFLRAFMICTYLYMTLGIMFMYINVAVQHRLKLVNEEIANKVVQQTQKLIDEYGDKLTAQIKSVTGRDVAKDPISMAASILDIYDQRDKKSINPLKSALDGTYTDNPLFDEDDEPFI